jgi:hypothetical protein
MTKKKEETTKTTDTRWVRVAHVDDEQYDELVAKGLYQKNQPPGTVPLTSALDAVKARLDANANDEQTSTKRLPQAPGHPWCSPGSPDELLFIDEDGRTAELWRRMRRT